MRRNDQRTGTKHLLAAAGLCSGLAIATLAFAQPHARPPARPAPATHPPAEDKAASGAASAQPPAAPPASSETGVIPAPPSDELADGGKLSPLNPAPNEFSDAGPPAATVDYDRLLADIASLRARVAAVSDTLFHSRIAIAVQSESDHARVASLLVSLDDGVVWSQPPTFRPSDETLVYDHAAAPGHHAVTVDVERRDDRNDAFRSSQRSRFVVDIPEGERLFVAIRIEDGSSMGGDFPSNKSGQYELKIRASAKAQPMGK
jgi:hypothetical protein